MRLLSRLSGILGASHLAVLAGLAAPMLPGVAQAEVVCSRAASEFDFTATGTSNMRAKLQNTDYFGPQGTAAPETLTFRTLPTVTTANLDPTGEVNDCDIYIGGGFQEAGSTDRLPVPEANALLAWSNADANHFVIGGCDSANNQTCAIFGRGTRNVDNAPLRFRQPSNLTYNPITCGGATIAPITAGGISGELPLIGNDLQLADHTAGNNPNNTTPPSLDGTPGITTNSDTGSPDSTFQNSRYLFTADADIFASSGNDNVGAGPVANTDNALFVVNAFKFALDAINDRNQNPSCFGSYDDEADLAISLLPSATTIESGDALDLTVTVAHQAGDAVGGVVVSVPVPFGMTLSAQNGTGSYDAGTGEWTIGTVAVGATPSIVLTFTAVNQTTNVASVASAQIIAADLADRDSMANIGFAVPGNPNDDRGDGIADDDEAQVALTLTAFDHGDAPGFADGTTPHADASHGIDGATHLGTQPDPERTAQTANGNASDDTDDGVTFPSIGGLNLLYANQGNAYTVTASVAGFLNVWADWDQDGVFEASEQLVDDRTIPAGQTTDTITFDDRVPLGITYIRVRFSTAAGAGPSGPMPNGEVEDYRVNLLHDVEVGLCENRLGNGGFENPTTTAGSFRVFPETEVPYWATIPNDPASGANFNQRNGIEIWDDGFNGFDAYEGEQFAELNAFVPGSLYQDFQVAPGSKLGWRFAHQGRTGKDEVRVLIGAPGAVVSQGVFETDNDGWKVYSGAYIVPPGQTVTRFALRAESTASNSMSVGNFIDAVEFRGACDLGDAPDSYGTSLASGGPVHFAGSDMRLGAVLGDTESDGRPDADATGDDIEANALDDEDGVTFGTLAAGATGTITVSVTGDGYLQGWIDFNGNGVFDGIEQIATDIRDADRDGTITLSVPIPGDAVTARTYARFRWSSVFDIGSGGLADDGEVEDYAIVLGGGGSVLSGRVLLDTGAGNGIAHDSALNGGETGTGTAATVEVLDAATDLPLGTVVLDGAGAWSMRLPVGFAGAVRVRATPAPGFSAISEATGGLPGLVNADPHDGSYVFTPAPGASYAGLNLGIIPDPTLTQSQTTSLAPGQIVQLLHRYTATTAAQVTFSLADIVSTPAGAFGHALMNDADCDGTPEGTVAPGARSVTAGQVVCLIVRTQSSSGASPAASATYALVAVSAFDRTTVTGTLRNDDAINGGTPGQMRLTKLVRNVTKGGPEGISNAGTIGDVLEYRIVILNPGTAPASNVEVYDQTPAWTALAAPVASPVAVTPAVTCTLAVPAAGTNAQGYIGPLRWTCPGTLQPGERGDVRFTVRIGQ